MLRRPWLFGLLFLALTLSSPAQQVDASAIIGSTPLDAPWRLHFGDDPAFAQPGFDDSRWTLHRIDKDWASEGHKDYAGYAWYRMRVTLPKGNEPLAIAVYPPAQAVEVYIDGALAGTIGRMRPSRCGPTSVMSTPLRCLRHSIAVPSKLRYESGNLLCRRLTWAQAPPLILSGWEPQAMWGESSVLNSKIAG